MNFIGRMLNRAGSGQRAVLGSAVPAGFGVEQARVVETANRWRDQYNPLRGIDMATAIARLEQAQRGEFADFQWLCQAIERRDADLMAIIERRLGMLQQMDWDIKTVEARFKQRGLAFDATLAKEQQAVLRGAYDAFTNLYEAIDHLELAALRGYAHVQFLAEGKLLTTLNPLDQWNILRNGLYGDWYWNPDARATVAANLPPENKLDLSCYLTRTVKRPINEFALIKYLRQNLSAKDWDAFLEIYGIPGWIVIMPPNVPPDKAAEYQAAAAAVAQGKSGALPNGSTVECADQPRGIAPFKDHLQYWSEQLVLAGTGGLLTMLTAPGSGTLAGSAHWEAFQIIARAEAKRISETFQRSIDRYLLELNFAGKPRLAYFELAANEEQDVGDILDHAVKIYQAGGQVDWTEISEKTGYTIVQGSGFMVPGSERVQPIRNRTVEPVNREPRNLPLDLVDVARQQIVDSALEDALQARRNQFAPWFQKLETLAARPGLDDAAFLAEAEALIRAMPRDLLTPENIAALAAPLEAAMGSAVANVILSQASPHVNGEPGNVNLQNGDRYVHPFRGNQYTGGKRTLESDLADLEADTRQRGQRVPVKQIIAAVRDVPQRSPFYVRDRAYVTVSAGKGETDPHHVTVRMWSPADGRNNHGAEYQYDVTDQDDQDALILQLRQLSRKAKIVLSRDGGES